MSSLQKIVDEMKELFPDMDEHMIKQTLINCDYDKAQCAELLFLAQESGMQTIPDYSKPPADHHNDVTLVYQDKIVTIKKDELSNQAEPQEKPVINTLNEEYKRAAEEDEQAYNNGEHLPQHLVVENKSSKPSKKKAKKEERQDILLGDDDTF